MTHCIDCQKMLLAINPIEGWWRAGCKAREMAEIKEPEDEIVCPDFVFGDCGEGHRVVIAMARTPTIVRQAESFLKRL